MRSRQIEARGAYCNLESTPTHLRKTYLQLLQPTLRGGEHICQAGAPLLARLRLVLGSRCGGLRLCQLTRLLLAVLLRRCALSCCRRLSLRAYSSDISSQ